MAQQMRKPKRILGVAQKYLRTIETNYPSRFVLHSNDRSLKSPYW